jgi:glycosyltransferase involved in cell wall biosynthesis
VRILLSNKFYYPRGGSDIYVIELEKLLKEYGHEVAVFSMDHPLNLESDCSEYFPVEIDISKNNLNNIIPAMLRPFGSAEVRKKFSRLLKDFNPDIVHLNNIHSQLSPLLSILAQNLKVPVVWTLHDHKLLCPRYDCMRNEHPCELCFTRKYNVVRYRCMKHSLMASLVAYAEAVVWNRKKLAKATNIFICPSNFLLRNMSSGGFKKEQLIPLHNFINERKFNGIALNKQDYYCYVGRLSSEKGIKTLLEAATGLPQHKLKVIGTGPLEHELRTKYEGKNIEFLGFRQWDELKVILENSSCMVIPSECYENNPLSVIESLCYGTPVVGSRIGGIPELIDPGINGLTFEAGNVSDLRNKISTFFSTSSDYNYGEIADNARAKFNSANYHKQLMKIYNNLLLVSH